MEREDFWGCQLTKSAPECTWNPEEESELDVEHRLMVVQACFGAKGRPSKEINVVQVTANNKDEKEVTCPIACLQEGVSLSCQVNLTFTAPVSFKLVEGLGPVSLTGAHMQALPEEVMDEESDDEGSPTGKEAPKLVKEKKRPLETAKGPPAKKSKVTAEDANEDEESVDDSEEEEEEDEKTVSKAKPKVEKAKDTIKSNLKNSEVELGSDSEEEDDDKDKDYEHEDEDDEDEDEDDKDDKDDEDDDEDEDDEDEDDEDDQDELDEESSEDEVTSTLTAKKESKGAVKKKPLVNGDNKKSPQKDINTIKQLLLKSRSLPKKMDKFRNYMKSGHKISDDKVVEDLWKWLQKNKK